ADEQQHEGRQPPLVVLRQPALDARGHDGRPPAAAGRPAAGCAGAAPGPAAASPAAPRSGAPPAAASSGGGGGGQCPLRLSHQRWSTFCAIGAAFAPPPMPCSTSTATTISGAATGAKAANQAWSRYWRGTSSPV